MLTGSLKFNSILEMGGLSIERAALTFGASIAPGGAVVAQTPAQLVRLTQRRDDAAPWQASTTAPWVSVFPASGTGSAMLSVSVSTRSHGRTDQCGAGPRERRRRRVRLHDRCLR